MKTLVIPTNRPERLHEFAEAWNKVGGWDKVIVVVDGPDAVPYMNTSHFDCTCVYYNWRDIDDVLLDDSWIISRRDSAIRAYGFLAAWKHGADYVLTLDDDCLPSLTTVDFFAEHLAAMNGHQKWVESFPGVRTRGLPYRELGVLEGCHASMGLWTGNLDYDAVDTLNRMREGTLRKMPPDDYRAAAQPRLIPHGQYFPMCGMNLCFTRAAIPLMYFPLMGENQTGRPWPYRRFDDIWAGVIAKKVFDHLGWNFSVGGCLVKHSRASDPFVNLAKEAPGIAENERFWKVVDGVSLGGTCPTGCMAEIGAGLRNDSDPHYRTLGTAIQTWAKLFE